MSVRTRFAPSPTGYLHIGGVRTALFNWLFAKGQGGQFLLRIDDTDQQRNVEEALAPILHGLKWLGLDWDEGPDGKGGDLGPHGPYYQSRRLDRYQAAAKQLLDSGAAYRDFARPEEIDAERKAAQEAGRPFIYSRKWRAETDADAKRFEAEGRQAVVRLLMQREGTLVLEDLVRGRVEFPWASEQDHVIQRADGTCLYHLASVVDDHDMQISHVIRAEEHLSNTPRQVFIFERLGYALPQFAHLPYVAEIGSKNKLSKRKFATYLKTSAEFREAHEHGIAVAANVDAIVEAVAKDIGEDNLKPEERERFFDDIVKGLTQHGPLPWRQSPGGPAKESLWIQCANAYFSNPKILKSYRHGQHIIEELGTSRSPEAFNPLVVDFYEETGYLPHAILNYLLLLGWSLDDKTEEFSRDEMIRLFSLSRVNKSPASFDPDKLKSFQSREMQKLSIIDRTKFVLRFFYDHGLIGKDFNPSLAMEFLLIVAAAGDRIKVAGDFLEYQEFFVEDELLPFDEKAFDKRIRKPAGAVPLLRKFRDDLAGVDPFTAERLEAWMHEWVAAQGIKIGDIVHVVRVAVTGKAVGFGLFDTLAILGRERCVARIDRALAKAAESP